MRKEEDDEWRKGRKGRKKRNWELGKAKERHSRFTEGDLVQMSDAK